MGLDEVKSSRRSVVKRVVELMFEYQEERVAKLKKTKEFKETIADIRDHFKKPDAWDLSLEYYKEFAGFRLSHQDFAAAIKSEGFGIRWNDEDNLLGIFKPKKVEVKRAKKRNVKASK